MPKFHCCDYAKFSEKINVTLYNSKQLLDELQEVRDLLRKQMDSLHDKTPPPPTPATSPPAAPRKRKVSSVDKKQLEAVVQMEKGRCFENGLPVPAKGPDGVWNHNYTTFLAKLDEDVYAPVVYKTKEYREMMDELEIILQREFTLTPLSAHEIVWYWATHRKRLRREQEDREFEAMEEESDTDAEEPLGIKDGDLWKQKKKEEKGKQPAIERKEEVIGDFVL